MEFPPVPPATAPPALSGAIQRRLVVWSPDGKTPVTAVVPLIPKAQIETMAMTALSLPYVGLEEEFQGMTNIEVALIRQARSAALGVSDDLKELLDRILGKSKWVGESKTFDLGYEDWLKEQDRLDKLETRRSSAISVEIVHPEPESFSNLKDPDGIFS